MHRITRGLVALFLLVGVGAGCKSNVYRDDAYIFNPLHLGEHGVRIVYEAHQFHLDLDRVFFGIDYPGGAPESPRQQYYGLTAPGRQWPMD